MTRRPETRKLMPGVLLALAAVVLCLVGTPFANGKLLGTIKNSKNTAKTGIYATCTGEAKTASAYFVYPFNEASGTTAADVSGNSHPGTYQNPTSDITFGGAGPCLRDGAKAITLNGTGYVTGAASTSGPASFSEEVWFKTPSTMTQGGKLIGLGNSATGDSGQYDRHIYMTNAGNLIFGVYPGSAQTIKSTLAYNDGKWHQVVASLSPSGTNIGMRLYVDGLEVVSRTDVTTAEPVGAGYWRVGYDNLNGWPDQPSNSHFKGSVAFASLYMAALTPAQVLAQYNAG